MKYPWVELEVPLTCECNHVQRRHVAGPCDVCSCTEFKEAELELWTRTGEYKPAKEYNMDCFSKKMMVERLQILMRVNAENFEDVMKKPINPGDGTHQCENNPEGMFYYGRWNTCRDLITWIEGH